MRILKIVALGLAGLLITPALVSGAEIADYEGQYDMYYTHAITDLTVTVALPTGDTIVVPLAAEFNLENEQIPYSVADDATDKIIMNLTGYMTRVPSQGWEVMEAALSEGMYLLVDVVNEEALRIPDQMYLTVENARYNMVNGLFLDLDVDGSEEFSLSGTLEPTDGSFSLMEVYNGGIDAGTNFDGDAFWGISDVSVEQTIETVTVQITGSIMLDTVLTRIADVPAAKTSAFDGIDDGTEFSALKRSGLERQRNSFRR